METASWPSLYPYVGASPGNSGKFNTETCLFYFRAFEEETSPSDLRWNSSQIRSESGALQLCKEPAACKFAKLTFELERRVPYKADFCVETLPLL